MASTSPARLASAADRGAPRSSAPPALELLDLTEVCRRTGLGKTTIYKLIAEGTFPRAVKATPRSSRWSAEKVEAWIQERIAETTDTRR